MELPPIQLGFLEWSRDQPVGFLSYGTSHPGNGKDKGHAHHLGCSLKTSSHKIIKLWSSWVTLWSYIPSSSFYRLGNWDPDMPSDLLKGLHLVRGGEGGWGPGCLLSSPPLFLTQALKYTNYWLLAFTPHGSEKWFFDKTLIKMINLSKCCSLCFLLALKIVLDR